jgi:hypothetical protein
MKTIIKSILMTTTVIFFLACGDNTQNPAVKDIVSIQIDNTNNSIYSTDKPKELSASVSYTDGSDAAVADARVWSSSDNNALNMYNGVITPTTNGGESTVKVSVGRFSDDINISVIKLTDFNISNESINTTGEHILEATGIFEDNTSKEIFTNIVWTANNGATITTDENYVNTIDIKSGDTNVTAIVFGETNTSAQLGPVTKTYSIN